MTHLLLVRHAETDMAGRFCGHSDPELNDRGRQQLAGLVNRLSEHAISRVFTSDLRRAQQTAQAIATHFGVDVDLRPGLREINFGQWEGLSWSEIEARDSAPAKNWADDYPKTTAPGGESFQQFQSRVSREMDFLLMEATRSSIVAVTHAGVIRLVLTDRCETSEREAWERTKDYCSVVAIDAQVISLRNTLLRSSTPQQK